ncbi:hypothetical protein D8B46_00570, partial [Candidatus Gracilibacteria bacterium]
MFEKIKKIFSLQNKGEKKFVPISNILDFGNKNSISKTELLNLFTGYSYVCISAVSEGIAGIDRKLFIAKNREDEEVNHKYIDLITNSFLEEVTGFLEIT